MQTIQIIGYLGKDAEIREFNGKKIVTFSVAVTRKYKDSEDHTTWYYCTRPYREDSNLLEFLTKGRRVFVRGELTADVFIPEDAQKQPMVSLRIACDKVLFLDKRPEEQASAVPTPPKCEPSYEDKEVESNDDLPF